MIMKHTMLNLFLALSSLFFGACADDDLKRYGVVEDHTPLAQTSVYPSAGGTVLPGTIVVRFGFEQDVWLLDKNKITVNGTATNAVAAIGDEVLLNVDASAGSDYEVRLSAGAIQSVGGYVSTQDYVATFSCRTDAPSLELSPEATNLMAYLEEINGKQVLSGAMANVNWNTNEAYWVYTKTGKYPAINCVDYIHLYDSEPGSWIDYSQTEFLENWWNEGGIVSAMWHWNMLANNGSDHTCTPGSEPEQTSFDIRKINDPESAEYAQMMADIDKVADYLLLLKGRNIPVIWRPLHEAGGGWFWWGLDAESCKTLWRVMYDRFQEKGLNNLIWVWTAAVAWNQELSESLQWYPGDEYVDVVGYDIYGDDMADPLATCVDYYGFLKENWPDKLVALTECGGVPTLDEQWEAGAQWLWFIPWYDYDRTNDINAPAFTEDAHVHADAEWWQAVVDDERVITRDEVPSLK